MRHRGGRKRKPLCDFRTAQGTLLAKHLHHAVPRGIRERLQRRHGIRIPRHILPCKRKEKHLPVVLRAVVKKQTRGLARKHPHGQEVITLVGASVAEGLAHPFFRDRKRFFRLQLLCDLLIQRIDLFAGRLLRLPETGQVQRLCKRKEIRRQPVVFP